jgi:hypothetical protein
VEAKLWEAYEATPPPRRDWRDWRDWRDRRERKDSMVERLEKKIDVSGGKKEEEKKW